MSTEAEEFQLRISKELRAELTRIYHDSYDTDLIEQRLTEEGIMPPDDRDGWSVAYAYGPNGEDIGLVWSEPSYPED
jgi:hypothetical protein